MQKTFNLRSIKTVSTFDYEVKDNNGEATGVVFTIAGPTHPVQLAIKAEAQERVATMMKKGGKPDMKRAMKEAEERRADILSRCTLGWSGYVDEAGAPVPFSTDAALALYKDPEMSWLADQVDEAMGNRDFFIKNDSAN